MTRRLRLVFDCDGVLLDSNRMKIDAFVSVLSAYPAEAVSRFSAFQQTAFGMSRYRLLDRFFSDFLGRAPAPAEKDALLEAFGAICTERYPRQPVTDGTVETLDRFRASGVPMHVVSGSDQAELRAALATLGLASYFASILGSPETKPNHLGTIRTGDPEAEIVFVGDAEADWKAAQAQDSTFLYLSTWAADRPGMARLRAEHGFAEIRNLRELVPVLLPHRQT